MQTLFRCPRTPTCINICAHIKDPIVHVSVQDYGNTKIPSMHCRLGCATVTAGFPAESNPNFPREKSQWDNTVVRKRKKKKRKKQGCSFIIMVLHKGLHCTIRQHTFLVVVLVVLQFSFKSSPSSLRDSSIYLCCTENWYCRIYYLYQ